MDYGKKSFEYMKLIILLIISIIYSGCNAQSPEKVETGADILVADSLHLLKNKQLGIVTNHTALLANGTHLVDTLHSMQDIKINSLFGPEHGIRGDAPDGQSIKDGIDAKTGIKVFSLYGEYRKPTSGML